MPLHSHMSAAIVLGALALASPCAQAAEPRPPDQQAFLDIYRELVEIDTTDPAGDTARAAQAMAARLRDGGVPAQDIRVISGPRKGNLVARLRGTGARRPLLLLAHLDVVEARREDWDSTRSSSSRWTAISAAAASSTTRRWRRSSSPT